MQIYLGLGSNIGDRRDNLRTAIAAIRRNGISIERISPVVESAALLPPQADSDWNRPYLNLAVRAETDLSPDDLLRSVKRIEGELGRQAGERWAPRIIDIDILLYGRDTIETDQLRVPHAHMHRRPFVLTPLIALNPGLQIPGLVKKTVLDWSRELDHHIPIWMGILNLTPDSFSDGGNWEGWAAAEAHVEKMVGAGAQIVDLGAESTRPGATPITADDEWARLAPVLEPLIEKYAGDDLAPLISIDTYHSEVARRAVAAGVDIVNDVTGLESPEMLALASENTAEWVAMHSVSIPADAAKTLPQDADAGDQIDRWIDERSAAWHRAGIDLNRLYVDPGIGFGKTPLQSLQLLRAATRMRSHGLRTLIGHSRKSFMSSFAPTDLSTRDLTTIGASLNLAAQGVDVIRVHNVEDHVCAYRGWAHLNSQ